MLGSCLCEPLIVQFFAFSEEYDYPEHIEYAGHQEDEEETDVVERQHYAEDDEVDHTEKGV